MSIKLLVLSVTALASASTLAVTTVQSPGPALSVNASPEVREWVGAAQQRVDGQLAGAGVAPGSQSLDVRMWVDGDGVLHSPALVRSSGSDRADAAVTAALAQVRADAPPPLLAGHSIVFHAAMRPVEPLGLRVGMIR